MLSIHGQYVSHFTLNNFISLAKINSCAYHKSRLIEKSYNISFKIKFSVRFEINALIAMHI